MYKARDDKTPPLFPELFPLGGALSPENRWARLAALVNWDEIDAVYRKYFSFIGRPARDSRMVAGIFMVALLEQVSDERATVMFNENPYIQKFCGLGSFATGSAAADGKLLYRARKRLGPETFGKFEREIIRMLTAHEDLGSRFELFKKKNRLRGWRGKLAGRLRALAAKLETK
ncbi:MAG: transposase [Elusimicrobiaceae bacterium]|nr:transposase [Elusimicrobiaceae bacterium]